VPVPDLTQDELAAVIAVVIAALKEKLDRDRYPRGHRTSSRSERRWRSSIRNRRRDRSHRARRCRKPHARMTMLEVACRECCGSSG